MPKAKLPGKRLARTLSVVALGTLTALLSFATLAGKSVQGKSDVIPDIPPDSKAIATALGWTPTNHPDNLCNGYYLDAAFPASALRSDNTIEITGNQMLFAQHGTSTGKGGITITRTGQLVSANEALLFRDPKTGKLRNIVLSGHVVLHEPENLAIARRGNLDLRTRYETLEDVYFRTTHYGNTQGAITKQPTLPLKALNKPRPLSRHGAFGHADSFAKTAPGIHELKNATYSTCPPLAEAWHIQADHIVLDQNTGRGTATGARLYLKNLPVFYTPWLNFPIDSRRKTGLLPPAIGTSNSAGGWFRAPFYWNIAPDHDATITPAFMAKRGIQLTGQFRYLTPTHEGRVMATILPADRAFSDFQDAMLEKYGTSTDAVVQADAQRLSHASTTRKAFVWHNTARYNEHLSSSINYNRVSDDYYLRDFSSNIDEVTQNQLLQQATLTWQAPHWQFNGRLEGYQTLHPVDQVEVPNQYTRLPQLALNGDWPDTFHGLNPFFQSEVTHFTITQTPGTTAIPPTGDRFHLQPGITRPFASSWFYITPRLQLAMTRYQLAHVTTLPSTGPSMVLPIFDVHSGLYFDRNLTVGTAGFRQTLEPEFYYTWVPYKNQNNIPVFDTITNTLNYDQLFSYNRFSGLDRVGDANQISYGVTTRLIDTESGREKLRAGVGQIFYFKNRRVTIGPPTPEDTYNKSPLSGMLAWQINPAWSLRGSGIWSVQTNQFQNQAVNLAFQPAAGKVVNLGFGFVQGGDINDSNLSQTDLSFGWPLSPRWSAVGRWTQNISHHHFQNLLYGLQYDTCCWAVRFVAVRTFTGLNPSTNGYQYDTSFALQFALKGLGNFGNSDPTQLLSSNISGYQSHFGQIT